MTFAHFSGRSRGWCCAIVLGLAACGSENSKSNPSSRGNDAGGTGSAGSSTSTGGSGSGAGTSAAAGNAGSSFGGVIEPSAGAPSTSGDGRAGDGNPEGGSGGHSATSGGSGSSGSSGGSGVPSGDCSREFLKGTIDAYFKALAAHSALGLPLADGVKVTENGKTISVGMDGLWKTAGTLKYAHSALDTAGCNTATEAVVPEGTTDLPVALRLKFAGGKLTEIETIAVRPGDYKVSGSTFASKPDAIIASNLSLPIKWEDPVPAAMRNSAAEMNAWMLKYFKAFPAGVCNTDSTCKRLENGNSPGGCNVGASCQTNDPTATVIKSHIIFSDVETGIGVGFDLFMNNTDMHMVKMIGGKVYAVHAVLGAATSTGWDDK